MSQWSHVSIPLLWHLYVILFNCVPVVRVFGIGNGIDSSKVELVSFIGGEEKKTIKVGNIQQCFSKWEPPGQLQEVPNELIGLYTLHALYWEC